MGWQSEDTADTSAGFVLGTTLYTPGHTQVVRINVNAEKQARHMHVRGDYDEWRSAINTYNRPEYARYALMSWLMFAAPLGRLLGINLPIAHFTSQGSGHGKTGTQDLLLSGAGNPRDPNGRWTGNTTGLSIYSYLTAMNGNVAILDEISAMHPDVLSKLMFEATLGSGRKAMAGASGQMRDLPPIHGLLVTSGNLSLQQLAQTIKGNSEAQVARVFEFNVARPDLSDAQRRADKGVFDKVYSNYGHAMPVFIEHITNNQAKVKSQLAKIASGLIDTLGMREEERFWRALLTTSITGALIASKLGIISHDVNALIPAALTHFRQQRTTVEDEQQGDSPLHRFIQNNQPAMIVVDTDAPTTNQQGIALVTMSEAHRPAAHVNIRMRYVEDSGRLYIECAHLKEFYQKHGYNYNELLTKAQKEGWLVSAKERRVLTANTKMAKPVRVMCVIFDMTKEKAFIDSLTKGSV
jgi:hypothetical protein